MKHCPFCHRIVWFWQSKCYLDARSKKPCHAYCWVWEMANDNFDDSLIVMSQNMGLFRERKPFLYHRKKEVEKVEDDTWRRNLKK